MAEIYNQNGEIITEGLQSGDVCDEAINAARAIARDRDEVVRLEDGNDCFDVHPDGDIEEADPWQCDCDACSIDTFCPYHN